MHKFKSSSETASLGRRATLVGSAAALAARGARAQTGGAQTGGAPTGAVRIGVLTDASGPYADSGGAGSLLAARMAVRQFGPVVLGQPIEVVMGDTQNKPDLAGSLARQWFDGGVDAITDLPVTPVALAVQGIAKEKTRTVMITAAAVTEFTSRLCSPVSSHWADDTHAMAAATGQVLTGLGGTTWFFITVDFSFGAALQTAATAVIEAAGGRVLGAARFPIGNTDFSSQVLQAQSSGAKVIGLAAVGGDQVNLIKGAAEFGLGAGGKQTLAGFLVYSTDIAALGLPVAQGLSFGSNFYWDTNEGTRAFSRAFAAERRAAMPTKNQAAVYAATLHFLKAMAAAGTRDPVAVNKAMRGMPVDWFGNPVALRADGRLMTEMVTYRVKTPAESTGPNDLYAPIGKVPPQAAYLPMDPACS